MLIEVYTNKLQEEIRAANPKYQKSGINTPLSQGQPQQSPMGSGPPMQSGGPMNNMGGMNMGMNMGMGGQGGPNMMPGGQYFSLNIFLC